jgi:hypothetical protein
MSSPTLPQLHILPTDSLIPHEDHDESRAIPLAARLKEQGTLRNPPIVASLGDGSGRYAVLDGANRVTAAKMLHLPHFLAQVATSDSTEVTLRAWNHVVWGMSPDEFAEKLSRFPQEILREFSSKEEAQAKRTSRTIEIQLADGRIFLLDSSQNPAERLQQLHAVVNVYKGVASLDRTNLREVEAFREAHASLTALVLFPQSTLEEVLQAVRAATPFPAGITRFTVSPRALHVNYPLEALAGDRPLKEKEAALQEWLQSQIRDKRMRYYEESTWIFNE